MRIIAGRWRGRPLAAPPGAATRPTSDRAREGLFSMLQSRLGGFEELAVLDLFAGTGALGLEALSRGAASCTFIEQDRAAIDALRRNVASLGAEAQAEIRPQDATALAGGRYDLVFLDPPYGSGLGRKALERLVASGALAPGALVSVESAADAEVALPGLDALAGRRYGKAKITLLRNPA
ncbi:MAG: 16S rRNA (guanine(966)-N(2))-methyltransferase RsmD [Allosphingosinicella sp.]|uniref:16S rRNA (guanine(966)-N(2))-methyltransferase RsmD n=1 Tax=Allosphingosinicella sp. TaxID=2823234 RepID=UPI00393739BF